MHKSPIHHRFSLTLVAAALLLPICISVVLGVAVLLEGMGDDAGGWVLRRIALAGGVVWVIDLISLLIVVSIETLTKSDETDE